MDQKQKTFERTKIETFFFSRLQRYYSHIQFVVFSRALIFFFKFLYRRWNKLDIPASLDRWISRVLLTGRIILSCKLLLLVHRNVEHPAESRTVEARHQQRCPTFLCSVCVYIAVWDAGEKRTWPAGERALAIRGHCGLNQETDSRKGEAISGM